MKFVSLVFILGLYIPGSICAAVPSKVDYQKQYAQQKKKYLNIEKKQRSLLGALYKIDKKLRITRKRATKTEEDYYSSQASFENLSEKISDLEKEISDQEKDFRSRLAQVYKMKGRESFLKVIFSAETPHQLKKMMSYTKRINAKDAEKISELKEKKLQLAEKKDKLSQIIRDIKNKEDDIKKQEASLEVELRKKNKIIRALQKQSKRQLKRMVKLRKKNSQWKSLKIELGKDFFESKGSLTSPVEGNIIKSYGFVKDSDFGYKLSHKGLLYKASKKGSEVQAIHQGTVVFSGKTPGYGKTVILDHGNHYYSVYSHLGRINAKMNSQLKARSKVGTISTISKKAYLYFELRHFSEAINPTNWLKKPANILTKNDNKEVKSEKLLSKK